MADRVAVEQAQTGLQVLVYQGKVTPVVQESIHLSTVPVGAVVLVR